MKFGLLQEADLTFSSNDERYHQVIEEVVLAENAGFSTYGTSEQHFLPPTFGIAAPEVLYAALAMKTERIRFRPMIVVPMTWHHPILIAERLATLDVLSRGRVELATGRGNNLNTLKVFGVDPTKTRAIYEEAMDAIENIIEHPDAAEFHGQYWDFPPSPVVPHFVGRRHPELSMAASSIDSHIVAAKRGYGVISFENYYGYDFLQECIDAYRKALPESTAKHVNDCVSLCVAVAYCGSTPEKAREVAGPAAMQFFQTNLDVYKQMLGQPGYEYMDRITTLLEKGHDVDWLIEATSVNMIGTPDDFIRRIKDLEMRGVDEVVLKIDGMPHKDIMESIDLIGREVIPEFR